MSGIRWHAALRRVARTLNDAVAPYKVVGGASVVLQGVEVETEDVDLEMSVEATYCFQARFAEKALLPVAVRESETYRAHFGRFEIDGVVFEVMGALHRRVEDGWTPAFTVTETTVDLEGVPLRVSWLEEETLAYIRRGRLERAAACLLHCDHARLMTLLRGRRSIHVL
jgi:hypothetical protein